MVIRFIRSIHRILGTLLSILFLVWFLSGFVMIYHTFPKVWQMDKWGNKEPLTSGSLPSIREICARIPAEETIRSLYVENFQEQTLFHVRTNKDKYTFPANPSETVRPITGETIRQIASRWSDDPVERIDTLYQLDQWIPFGRLEAEFPIYKFHYGGAGKKQIYISSRTGEVLQSTTEKSRFWAWLGAIPHWVYFTSLRQNGRLWSDTVVWLSGIGCILCVAGLAMGIHSFCKHRRRKRYEFSPYRKTIWKWHHLAGLVFGLFIFTFVFSGMMSLASVPEWVVKVHNPDIEKELRKSPAIRPEAFTLDYRTLIATYPEQVKQIEWELFGDIPLYKTAVGNQTLVFDASHTEPVVLYLDSLSVSKHITTLHPEPFSVVMMNCYDNYYVGRTNHLPLPVYKIEVNDPDKSLYYINPRNGSIRYFNQNKKVQRWSYQGLHSFKFRFLAERPVLWNILMWTTMTGGTIVSLTGVWLGIRYLVRKCKKIKNYICRS